MERDGQRWLRQIYVWDGEMELLPPSLKSHVVGATEAIDLLGGGRVGILFVDSSAWTPRLREAVRVLRRRVLPTPTIEIVPSLGSAPSDLADERLVVGSAFRDLQECGRRAAINMMLAEAGRLHRAAIDPKDRFEGAIGEIFTRTPPFGNVDAMALAADGVNARIKRKMIERRWHGTATRLVGAGRAADFPSPHEVLSGVKFVRALAARTGTVTWSAAARGVGMSYESFRRYRHVHGLQAEQLDDAVYPIAWFEWEILKPMGIVIRRNVEL